MAFADYDPAHLARERDMRKVEPNERYYIACDTLDFAWTQAEIDVVKRMWKGNAPVMDIADELLRCPDEVLIVIISLARDGKIPRRPTGIVGRRR